MSIEPLLQLEDVYAVLRECQVPCDNLNSDAVSFYGIRRGGELVGLVGLELHAEFGFVRTLAIRHTWRGEGMGGALLAFAESHSLTRGADRLYLIASCAVPYFLRQGYSHIARDHVPINVRCAPLFRNIALNEACLTKQLDLMG